MAKDKSNSGMVYGVDCKRLGSLYASALIANAQEKLEELPALVTHSVYTGLKGPEQEAVRRNIHTVARDLLLSSGLSPEKVDDVMNKNNSNDTE